MRSVAKKVGSVKYISTRGRAPTLAFEEILLAGLADDGGLYVPAAWPRLSKAELEALRGASYAEVAFRVIRPFVGDAVGADDLRAILDDSCRAFGPAGVAPLRKLGSNEWLLELFHGPTLAFKDVALQLLGRLFNHVLKRRGERITVIGATSGDTGSAAIAACQDQDAIEVFILHPKGRVSEVQRRQMTTVASPNVHNIAIEGTFDDCQALVKAMFGDEAFRRRHRLSAVNSINWARIMAQSVYYVAAGLALGAPGRRVAFAVPTGNFGNVFAGYAAREMGLGIEQLIIGSNRNDILTRFFESGTMQTGPVFATLSPSMDIQVSSNFERLLFELYDRDGAKLADVMDRFRTGGRFSIDSERLRRVRALFDAARFDDDATKATIKTVYEESGILVDPHTAVGVAAGRAKRRDAATPLVAIATAHPAKFPDAIAAATGVRPPLPESLATLLQRPERCATLANDLQAVKDFVAKGVAGRKAA